MKGYIMRAEKILAAMSLREKIAQTFMVDFRKWNGEDMRVLPKEVADAMTKYKFGSFILFANNVKTTEETFALTKALQKAAVKDGGLPLLITIDQEGGIVVRLGSGAVLPGNMALCASGKPENARISGNIIGKELLSVGINCTLAPAVDVNNNANNPIIGLRSFSDDPGLVSTFGNAYVDGVTETGAIACIKHFPGHGDTDVDSHYGLPKVEKNYDELKNFELVPFASAIENGAEMVMTAHILYPDLDNSDVYSRKTGRYEKRPATMSHRILTEILKEQMGFDGVICTDAINMAGVAANFDNIQTSVEALAAGADMLCMPVADVGSIDAMARFEAIFDGMEEAVSDGTLSMERLDNAVLRILRLKEKHGILDYKEDDFSQETAEAALGCKRHRDEERRMANEAVTLVKYDKNSFPLKPEAKKRILFMFPYAAEETAVSAGFERAKEAGKMPSDARAKYYFYTETDFAEPETVNGVLDWADSVVIISEIASAARMQYTHWMSGTVKYVTDRCRTNGKTSVVISVDKPYDVQLYPGAGAVLAVYGSKASGPNISAGIEAALGAVDPAGKLPVNIPVFDEEKGSYSDEIVFRRGYGLRSED